MKLITVKTTEIKLYDNNPRIHSESSIDKLVSSIEHYGWTNPVLLSKDGYLVAGYGRLEAAIKAEKEEIPAIQLDLEGDDAKAYMIADNRLQEDTKWDMPLLADIIKELESNDYNLDFTGFGQQEIEDLFQDGILEAVKDDGFDVDEAMDSIDEPITHLGDIWRLGNHVLICGDATDANVYERLMNNQKADLVLTDPPYNVNYEGVAGKIQNDNLSDNDFLSFLTDAFSFISDNTKAGCGFYVFYAFAEIENFKKAIDSNSLLIKQNLTWVKNHFVLGRQDYQWKHEPILYGWKEGDKHNWYGGFDKSTVIECNKPLKSELHPTMKPIELLSMLLNNSTRKGDIVLDAFGGSGSTLISCEEMGRCARLIELDPVFCDVIVKRYKDSYGEEGVLHEPR